MKKQRKKDKMICLRVTKDMDEVIRRMARNNGVTRAYVYRRLIMTGLLSNGAGDLG